MFGDLLPLDSWINAEIPGLILIELLYNTDDQLVGHYILFLFLKNCHIGISGGKVIVKNLGFDSHTDHRKMSNRVLE